VPNIEFRSAFEGDSTAVIYQQVPIQSRVASTPASQGERSYQSPKQPTTQPQRLNCLLWPGSHGVHNAIPMCTPKNLNLTRGSLLLCSEPRCRDLEALKRPDINCCQFGIEPTIQSSSTTSTITSLGQTISPLLTFLHHVVALHLPSYRHVHHGTDQCHPIQIVMIEYVRS
jgi:hypothetical protein